MAADGDYYRPREPQLGDVKELAEAMLRQRVEDGAQYSPIIFFIGAGCSVSAGVPTGKQIAQNRVLHFANLYLRKPFTEPTAAYNALIRSGKLELAAVGAVDPKAYIDVAPDIVDWGSVYDAIFKGHLRSPKDIRKYFGQICDSAHVKLNWAHLCLGELVRQKHVSTIITTNFDQLVLTGLVHAGIIPTVSDGVESLNRIDPSMEVPQLIELHGSRHTYKQLNDPNDVAAVKEDYGATATLLELFRKSGVFVVVGYAGRETGAMDLLVEAGRHFPDHEIVWVAHEDDPKKLEPKARAFLATSRNGRLIPGRDADEFFLDLCRELGVGAPRVLLDPLATLTDLIDRLAVHQSREITEEIADARKLLTFLKQAQFDHRSRETELERVLREAQAFKLSGERQKSYELLNPVAERLDDRRIWVMLGDAALELGENHPEQALLRRSVEAYKKATEYE